MRNQKNLRPALVLSCLLLSFFFFCSQAPSSFAMSLAKQPKDYQVAMHTFGFWDQANKLKLDIAVWYPGQTQTRIAEHDGWIVQTCSHKQSVAKVIPGFYPVILLSHDTASSYFANNDVAAHLASQGFFVIVPAHTGDTTTSGDTIYQAELLYDRPLQLLKALDLVLSNQHFAPFVDESRIGLLGVGAGAITTAQLTGLMPQADLLASYCRENSVYDLSCAGWTDSLLTKFQHDHDEIIKRPGRPLTPHLATFAPQKLEIAPIPPEEPEGTSALCEEEEALNEDNSEQRKKSLLTKIKEMFKKTLPDKDTPAVAKQEPELPDPKIIFDFHGGIVQTETLMGNPFVVFKESTAFPWIFPVTVPEKEPQAVAPLKAKQDTRPFRRPAEIRQIKAIALLAPTGAFYFDDEKPNTALPALSIFPEFTCLYPHAYQAEPYRQLFPSYHEVEVIRGTDHFSLFASCTEQAREFLPENCGTLNNEDKAAADKKKMAALRLFFKQYLGAPYPPQPLTGLKAADE